MWHGGPVWFIDENPIVGYWVRKEAAELRITDATQMEPRDLKRWLRKSRIIQWDYKNIAKRRGVLEKIGDW